MARIRVGTASWTDHEPFYPPEYSRSDMKSRRIEYYARYFDVVEVDSTFYHLMPARNFAMWAERTPADFIFDVKAYGEMTWHHRDSQGEAQAPQADTFSKFSYMIEPLREAKKLGAILFQFPPWFTFGEERIEYFDTIREAFPDDTVAIEFRHRSWLEGDRLAQTRSALTERQLAFCAVDEPQVGAGSAPPVMMVTNSHFSMTRFHGRNRKMWYGKGLSSSRDRFDYLYSREELEPWVKRIRDAAAQLTGSEAHVITNNNASNYGIVNALDLQSLFGLPVGLGQPLPEGPLHTIRERDGGPEPEEQPQERPADGPPTLWGDEL